ncbi:SUN domain-containing protein 3 isoform X1 [Canis lupus familiaris]|uniref:SUN domain-containing protein 3 isoform X1 n=1 Tax=Canis lupus familiaris TaxID=9615 RepID=UPI000BAA10D4|nr:SUN domain-containing protein 3 isoform X1 [Canis lupus familiaris]|eukprot:XP_022260845.1 SUN domain-containing protein 3 isoform X2 [Canis lupus familiaris]
MSGRPKPRRGARLFRAQSEEAGSSASLHVALLECGSPDPNGLTRSTKMVLSTLWILTLLLVGLGNHRWLKEAEFPQKSRHFYALVAEYGSRLYNYQARLRMPKEQLELLKKESQTLENNFREILFLIEQIDVLKALLRDTQEDLHSYSWNTDQDEDQDPMEATDEEMSNLVNYVLKKLREDQVQMADYALKSAGASIVEAGTSESYKNNKAKLYWHGIGFLTYEMPPDIILQPDVHPGKCWAFPGSQGHALIKLARKIVPTAVTMEHISEKVSPSGNISSAPKEFSVYGISKQCEGEEIFLGQFVYNKTGSTVQTFELQERRARKARAWGISINLGDGPSRSQEPELGLLLGPDVVKKPVWSVARMQGGG